MTDGAEPEGVGDNRQKHVTVYTVDGHRYEHGDVYLRHATGAFLVSPDVDFPVASTERYPKERLVRVKVSQHHSACFLTTATTSDETTLDVLRRFRDDAMTRTPIGRVLVGVYYAVSPPVAATLADHPESHATRAIRWWIQQCGRLAQRREAAETSRRSVALTVALTLSYAVGLLLAVGGHLVLRAREQFSEGR